MVFVFLIFSLAFLHLVAGNEICDQMQGYDPILTMSSLGPAEAPAHISLLRTMHLYWLWIVHLFVIVVLLAFYSTYVHNYNNLLKEAIFELFGRVEKGAIKGSGLGLAIAKKIVELHGGQVDVTENPKSKGSVFWATFPKA